MIARGVLVSSLTVAACACGGPATEPNVPARPAPVSQAPKPVASTTSYSSPPASAPVAPPPRAPSHQLVGETSKDNPFALTVILPGDKPTSEFPAQVEQDATCWKKVALRGNHDQDYETLMATCGEPTGLLPYTDWIESRLHDISHGNKKDLRDFYKVGVRQGMCYRFIAVGDESMVALDMHLYKANGALIGTADTKSPALLMQSRALMCPDHTEDWILELDVDGNGEGRYKFAVWTRPAK